MAVADGDAIVVSVLRLSGAAAIVAAIVIVSVPFAALYHTTLGLLLRGLTLLLMELQKFWMMLLVLQ